MRKAALPHKENIKKSAAIFTAIIPVFFVESRKR
jgi:hypothetical protein